MKIECPKCQAVIEVPEIESDVVFFTGVQGYHEFRVLNDLRLGPNAYVSKCGDKIAPADK